jgi:hypothetical protein
METKTALGVAFERRMRAMQMPKRESLKGRRVLVVEDELLVALDYCHNLESAGAEVVGPFQTAQEAMRCVKNAAIDAAVLDYAPLSQTVTARGCRPPWSFGKSRSW